MFFALGAVSLNLVSWIFGISRLIYSSAKKGILPRVFQNTNHEGEPQAAMILLWVLFTIAIIMDAIRPDLFKYLLSTVSTNFVILYFLALASYMKVTTQLAKRSLCLILLVGIMCALFQQKVLLIYPLILIGIGYSVAKSRGINSI